MVEVDIDGGDKMREKQDEDDANNEIDGDSKSKEEKSEQKEDSDEEFDDSSTSGPGGLVGLITNLSGVL